MDIHGLEERRGDLTHGLVVIRFRSALDPARQRDVRRALVAAGIVAFAHDAQDADGDEAGAESSSYVTGSWLPPDSAGLAGVRATLAAFERDLGAEQAWFFQVATEIDAFAESEDEDDDAAEDEGAEPTDDAEDAALPASQWKAGPPPRATATSFPLERYPEMLSEFTGEDFGISVKLGGPALAGEAGVIEAMHRFWLEPYVDRRLAEAGKEVDEDDLPMPFRNAGVAFDAEHRSALLWVDRFFPPATVDEIVHHLVWIAEQLSRVITVQYARFDEASIPVKYGAMMGDGSPVFVLAGNPLAARFDAEGEDAAVAWAEAERARGDRGVARAQERGRDWDPTEIGAMYVELGRRNDPTDPASAAVALRMFERALALDPTNVEAAACVAVVLVLQGRADEAIARATSTDDPAMRVQALQVLLEHAPESLARARALIDEATLDAITEEALGALVAAVAQRAPGELEVFLGKLPSRAELAAHLYNASFKVEDAAARLRLLERVMALPVPSPDDEPNRSAYTMAFSNACVLAHAQRDYARALAIADAAQAFTQENPYIHHSAACAYVAVGEHDKAFEQVKRAVLADYDHLDKLEEDTDLGPLLAWPLFKELFANWRAEHAKSEPVLEVDEASFDAQVLRQDRPVLVDFTASWCAPCKSLAPTLEAVARESMGNYRVVKVDIDASPALAERYGVQGVPTLVVVEGGEERGRHVGVTDKRTVKRLLAG